jgi:hypothetical protein
VDHGVIQNNVVEAELGAQEGDYFDSSEQAIRVRERNISRGLTSAHGYIPHFDLHAKRSGVEAPNLGTASRDALDFCDQPATDESLKRVGGDVPDPGDDY